MELQFLKTSMNMLLIYKKNVSIKFLDYRKIKKKYDKIVSIEMFEAVGKNWDTFSK